VPAAFYRHFESIEALGLVLIDESFALCATPCAGGAGKPTRTGSSSRPSRSWSPVSPNGAEHWAPHRRERNSAPIVLRYAIRTEIRRSPPSWPPTSRASRAQRLEHEDLNVLATLFVNR